MTKPKWSVAGYDRAEAVRLTRSGINPLVSVLLSSRGATSESKIEALTSSELSAISDPFLMADMDKAAERVRRAIENREHVAVYGDYDVDGITSSCVVADYLRSRGIECDIYIPERLEEGYGVKDSALETIAEKGVSLVITVDCGITAAENKRFAASLGMDMVITDHHEVSGERPTSPVVDPKRPDCPSPAKMLAGVGVAFKLICAVDGVQNTESLLNRYADLVAVGTIADVMPMIGENRVFVKRGLQLVRDGARPGLSKLIDAAGANRRKMTVTGIGYTLAPRINAAGRLGGTDVAVNLLLSENSGEAEELAKQLCFLNTERRRIEAEMVDEATEMLEKEPPMGRPIVLMSEGWHQGVAGIVASRISEKYNLPAIMVCVKDGIGRGSCRSSGGYNIFEALSANRDILLSFGGHELAAGITISAENVSELRTRLGEAYVAASDDIPEPTLAIDFEVIKPELLSVANVMALDELEPFGTGNPAPVLCMKNMTVEAVVPLSGGKHTKLRLEKSGMVFDGLFFGKEPDKLEFKSGDRVDAAFNPQVNEFRGKRTVQLNLIDAVINRGEENG
ncbi:MAG: single-stranded-DNA-specific exonuclease RecJ [Oscillospiraceae bacterium]|nr:single-stranded-DNA-specific exonuclease RecJ [Oscillospiraceae bacterium]